MGQAGMGVMIGMLGGNSDTVSAYHAAMNKTIKSVELNSSNELVIRFDDGFKLVAKDDGQSCCEHRYMRTDDDLDSWAGSKLVSIEIKQAPEVADEWGEHEVQFLEVMTDKGCFTMTSHNEHNGYYGGFWITLYFTADD